MPPADGRAQLSFYVFAMLCKLSLGCFISTLEYTNTNFASSLVFFSYFIFELTNAIFCKLSCCAQLNMVVPSVSAVFSFRFCRFTVLPFWHYARSIMFPAFRFAVSASTPF